MDISILIATYKRPKELEKTLRAFTQLDLNELSCQILIVDNANDQTTAQLVANFRNILPIEYKTCPQRGKSRALNLGLPLCVGEIIVFTDDDILPEPQWLKEIIVGTKRWSNFSIFGGKILPDKPEIIPPILKELKSYTIDYAVADWNIAEGPCSGYQVFGPNFAIRKKILDENIKFNILLGGGAIFPMGEDTQFVLDFEKKGIKPVYLPKALVYHQIRPEQSTLQWSYQRSFNGGRADIYQDNEIKMAKLFHIPRYLFKKTFLTWIEMFQLMIKGNKKDFINKKKMLYRYLGQMYQYQKIKNQKLEDLMEATYA